MGQACQIPSWRIPLPRDLGDDAFAGAQAAVGTSARRLAPIRPAALTARTVNE